MTRPAVFSTDTKLYHPSEPKGRVFPAGETDPGAAWTEQLGGKPAGEKTVGQAAKDLLEAHEQIEAHQSQLETQNASMAILAGERDDAVGKLEAAENAKAEAERDRDAARAEAEEAVKAKNQAVEYAATLEAKLAKLDGDGDGNPGGTKPAPEPAQAGGTSGVPENWRDLHWMQRVKLAKDLGAAEDVDMKAADAFLEAKVAG